MNNVILIGRLAKKPEIIKGEIAIGKMVLAVRKEYSVKDGEKDCDFFNLSVFGKQAENCYKMLDKGSAIGIKGKLENHSWTDKDGNKRLMTQVKVDMVDFFPAKKEELPEASDDSLPF